VGLLSGRGEGRSRVLGESNGSLPSGLLHTEWLCLTDGMPLRRGSPGSGDARWVRCLAEKRLRAGLAS